MGLRINVRNLADFCEFRGFAMKIAVLGYGHVAHGFLELLQTRRVNLQTQYHFEPQVIAISTRQRGLYNASGLELNTDVNLTSPAPSLDQILAEADVLVELTPTNVQTGGAGLEHIRLALTMGKHVVTANKGPLVVAYRELASLAKSKGVQFRYEGTVMGGTPSMVLGVETLAAAGIKSVRGIINGTTNYILTQMESGNSYEAALKEAQALGYAEADPTGDVEGWDAAAKTVILANTLMGGNLRISDVDRIGITGITVEMVEAARAANQRWKLIAEVALTDDGLTASVRPSCLPVTDPLAMVSGSLNALTYSTAALGDVTLIGPGAGGKATGFAVLADVLKIHNHIKGA